MYFYQISSHLLCNQSDTCKTLIKFLMAFLSFVLLRWCNDCLKWFWEKCLLRKRLLKPIQTKYSVPNLNSPMQKSNVEDTDLDSLIRNLTVDIQQFVNLAIFLPLILREINFGRFVMVKNCHFNNFGGFEF